MFNSMTLINTTPIRPTYCWTNFQRIPHSYRYNDQTKVSLSRANVKSSRTLVARNVVTEIPRLPRPFLIQRNDIQLHHDSPPWDFLKQFSSRFSPRNSKLYCNLEIYWLRLVEIYQCFEGINCLHLYLSTREEEDMGSTQNLELVFKDSVIRVVYFF
jgi:hypothetical protein